MKGFRSFYSAYRWILMILPVFFNCAGEELDFCSNPIGSKETTNGNMALLCFQDGFNGCIRLEFDPPEYAFQAVLVTGGGPVYGELIDVGEVDCLKRVVTKPITGYSYRLDILEHHGYVVRFTNNTYGRFFVDSWSGSGSTLKVNLTWQFSY